MPRASVRGRLILVALLAVLTWSQSMLEAAGQALVSRRTIGPRSLSAWCRRCPCRSESGRNSATWASGPVRPVTGSAIWRTRPVGWARVRSRSADAAPLLGLQDQVGSGRARRLRSPFGLSPPPLPPVHQFQRAVSMSSGSRWIRLLVDATSTPDRFPYGQPGSIVESCGYL